MSQCHRIELEKLQEEFAEKEFVLFEVSVIHPSEKTVHREETCVSQIFVLIRNGRQVIAQTNQTWQEIVQASLDLIDHLPTTLGLNRLSISRQFFVEEPKDQENQFQLSCILI